MGRCYDLYVTDYNKSIDKHEKSKNNMIPSYDTQNTKTCNYDVSSGYLYNGSSNNCCKDDKICKNEKNFRERHSCRTYKVVASSEDGVKIDSNKSCREENQYSDIDNTYCKCNESINDKVDLKKDPKEKLKNHQCKSTPSSDDERNTCREYIKDYPINPNKDYLNIEDEPCREEFNNFSELEFTDNNEFSNEININIGNNELTNLNIEFSKLKKEKLYTKRYSDITGKCTEEDNGDLYYEEYHTADKQCNNISGNEICQCVQGNSLDVNVKNNDSDIRADLVLETKSIMRIWGQIKNNYGAPVGEAIVSLLKPGYVRGEINYICTATTITDYMGFYQFELDNDFEDTIYKIIVSKSTK